MLSRDRSTYTIKAVENALFILEAISEEAGEFGVSHLSNKLNMNKSYIFRMLATFERHGYVQQIETSCRYRAGISAYETSSNFLHKMKLLSYAKPVMETLAKTSGEAIYLAIPGENDFLFLEMVESPQQVRVMPLAGKRFALHQFSAGKVFLEHIPNSNNQRSSQSQGAFVDHGAVGEGITSLAVPILNAQGLACASLCLLAPEFRLNDHRIKNVLLPQLISAGKNLSAKLGHIDAELLSMCG